MSCEAHNEEAVIGQLSFLRAIAIGGIFFLLPLAVLLFFLGQIAQVIFAVAVRIQPWLGEYLGIKDATGYALVFAIAVTLLFDNICQIHRRDGASIAVPLVTGIPGQQAMLGIKCDEPRIRVVAAAGKFGNRF
ncbi:hypothetical protein UC8_10480 [Roseimaritima ulvae]|uniref:Uncharacterized protein n=1 Tax=Roseimaritima ulvae TaxID=980254 RepID=A0A5B9QIZ9_9BACT|nr:hypothetical protein UC8_10480 [Roseimaritima ulvae]